LPFFVSHCFTIAQLTLNSAGLIEGFQLTLITGEANTESEHSCNTTNEEIASPHREPLFFEQVCLISCFNKDCL
jgi:hypothetical protein